MTELLSLGLIDDTSSIQEKNGTTCFIDPQTGARYLSYNNGYVRRETRGPRRIYQLNKTRTSYEYYESLDKHLPFRQRVLESSEKARFDIIANAVVSYRNRFSV
jgi:hypothetical protein